MHERNPTDNNNNPSDVATEDRISQLEAQLRRLEALNPDLPNQYEQRQREGGLDIGAVSTQHGIRRVQDRPRGENDTPQTERLDRALFQREIRTTFETLFGREQIQNGEFVDSISILGPDSAQVGDIFFIVNYVYPFDSYPPLHCWDIERCEVIERIEDRELPSIKIHLKSYPRAIYRNEMDMILTEDIMINNTVNYYRLNGSYSHTSDAKEIFFLNRQRNEQ